MLVAKSPVKAAKLGKGKPAKGKKAPPDEPELLG